MPRRQRLFVAFVLVLTMVVPGISVIAPPPASSGPHFVSAVPFSGIRAANATSYNWAGYVATGNPGSVSYVHMRWKAPNLLCNSTTSLEATWLGIDGYNSTTVEQIGTMAQCSGGVASYYAWWELYPSTSIQIIGKITVHANDLFVASVFYSITTNEFKLVLRDITTRITFVKTASQPGAMRNSAECIVEAPSGDNSTASGIYPLVHFKSEFIRRCSVVGSSVVLLVNMVSYPSGSRVLASTGPWKPRASFAVDWHYGY